MGIVDAPSPALSLALPRRFRSSFTGSLHAALALPFAPRQRSPSPSIAVFLHTAREFTYTLYTHSPMRYPCAFLRSLPVLSLALQRRSAQHRNGALPSTALALLSSLCWRLQLLYLDTVGPLVRLCVGALLLLAPALSFTLHWRSPAHCPGALLCDAPASPLHCASTPLGASPALSRNRLPSSIRGVG